VHGRGDDHDHAPTAGAAGDPPVWAPFRVLGAYSELVWPAIAGSALLGGYLCANAEWTVAAYALYAVAYVAGGWEATRDGFRQLLRGRLDIDFLMVVGAIGAALVGEFAEGALLLFLFSLGHGLEYLALSRAKSAVSALAKLAPKRARVRGADGTEREVAWLTELIHLEQSGDKQELPTAGQLVGSE